MRSFAPRSGADPTAMARRPSCCAIFSISTSSTTPRCAASSTLASPTRTAGATGRLPARPWR